MAAATRIAVRTARPCWPVAARAGASLDPKSDGLLVTMQWQPTFAGKLWESLVDAATQILMGGQEHVLSGEHTQIVQYPRKLPPISQERCRRVSGCSCEGVCRPGYGSTQLSLRTSPEPRHDLFRPPSPAVTNYECVSGLLSVLDRARHHSPRHKACRSRSRRIVWPLPRKEHESSSLAPCRSVQ
jgi:hypothetical protein